ncbi:MAG: hypothetical protein ACRYF4_05940 [Janthinobacterium lividum]
MGNPLISDAAMRGMYDTMQRMQTARRDPDRFSSLSKAERATALAEPESLLAALLSQVHRRDTLLTQGSHPLLPVALASSFPVDAGPAHHSFHATGEECAAVTTGMALRALGRIRASSGGMPVADPPPLPVFLCLLREFPKLTTVLTLMEQDDLPVVLVVGGPPESRSAAQRRLQSTDVPVMPVDWADAVAVCRVAQESLLRARSGWGGAVIHATQLPGSPDPLLLLEGHMSKRGLLSAPA